MALKICQTIYTDINTPLFHFPKYTLLDDIPWELWDTIVGYFRLEFHIGDYGKEYEGFRQVTKIDVNDYFKSELLNKINYQHNMHNLGKLPENNIGKIILVDDCYLLIDNERFTFKMNHNHIEIYIRGKQYGNIATIKTSLIRRVADDDKYYSAFFIPVK
jgi:hypothetical protein